MAKRSLEDAKSFVSSVGDESRPFLDGGSAGLTYVGNLSVQIGASH